MSAILIVLNHFILAFKNFPVIKEGIMYKQNMSLKDYLYIILGAGFMAVAIQLVYEPSHLVTGGFSGVGILIKNITTTEKFSGVPVGLTTFLLNVPLFIWAYCVKGIHFIKRSLLGMVSLSLWLTVLPVVPLKEEDLVLASLFGGGLNGIGLGLIFMSNGTTGGTDMLAALLNRYFPQYSMVRIMQILDGIIVALGAVWFGISRALYAMVAIFVFSKISDGLLEGLKFAKTAYIITEQPEKVAKELLSKLKRGVTGWDAKGMYTGKGQTILLCVVGKKEIVTLKNIVHEMDENAFVVVGEAREVYGEGFLKAEKY